MPVRASIATADCTADLDSAATSLAIHCTHNDSGAAARRLGR